MGTEPVQAGPGRRVAAMVLVAIAALLAFLALMSIWVNRQLLDTSNWTRTSTEILEQPAVRNLLAARLTDQLYESVDVEAAVREVLPTRAEVLAGPAASALRDQVEKRAQKALSRPRVQQLWADANRVAHQQFIDVIDGGGRTVSTADGRVVLNVDEMLAQLQAQTGVGGRLRRALPASATEITVFQSDQLRAAQTTVRVLRPLPIVLIVLSVVIAGIAMAIAPGRRRQVLRAYGFGFVAAGAGALLTRSLAGDAIVDSLARTAAAEPAVAQVWTISTDLLDDIATATIAYGVVMIIAAWIAGPARPATAVRRAIAPYLREPAIAYSGLAVAVAALIWWAPTPAWRNAIMAGILIALLAAGVEALRRQVIREFPDATRADASERRRERLSALTSAGRERAVTVKQWTAERASSASAATRDAIAARAASAEDDRLARLERLAKLRESGILDDAEFRAEKQRILNETEQLVTT